jgi:glycosyltransferase involved in cell wall biosynthesis
MRVLLLNSIGKSKWGGGEKWMILAAKGLIRKGHQAVIGCRPGSELGRKALSNNIPVFEISIGSDISLSGAIRLWHYSRQNKFDIIIGCQNKDVRIAGVMRRLIGNPVVLSRQGVRLLRNRIKYRLTFLPFCDGIITNTITLKKEYDSFGWWDKDFVKVIHNGVEVSDCEGDGFDYHSFINGQSSNPKIVLSAGRLASQKGYDVFIDAAEQVSKQRKDVFFFIAGEGKLKIDLLKRIVDKGLSDRVFIVGFQRDLGSMFRGADLFVLSSLYEGMPNVVMEAMANCVPVVSSEVNGVSELLGNNQCGIIVPPGDSEALQKAILGFFELENPKQMIDNAHQRIIDLFSVDKMVDELENYLSSKIIDKIES